MDMDCPKGSASAAVGFPNDPLLEIVSRVPFRSMCRFKCVAKAWHDLIVDPLHRRKLPQTLEGLFHEVHRRRDESAEHNTGRKRRHGCVGYFDLSGTSVPIVEPFFTFLPKLAAPEDIRLLDTCHGLLLLDRCYNSDTPSYVVCNPATEQWVAVPESDQAPPPENGTSAYLMSNPDVSGHFDLIQFEVDVLLTGVTCVHTYSSKTGAWTHSESDWSVEEKQAPCEGWRYQSGSLLVPERKSTVINGMLYLICDAGGDGPVLDGDHLIAVDAQGKTRELITLPFQMQREKFNTVSDFVGQSQGLLHYVNHAEPEEYTDYDYPSEQSAKVHTEDADDVDSELSIWVLKGDGTQEWDLKHSVSFLHLFGEKSCQAGVDYNVVAIHPDRDMVFFLWHDQLISYDMCSKEVLVLHTISDTYGFASYVPCFSESPALTNKF
ncbi:hypothetical protein U9M48_010215 [Paspalum notatum var. saurae]|uniref:F-box domain-containing protein n=1 Tax=Paspalum notatum var. saurae TaxID=547442 RepID=A0AAQ3WG04_PASNO